MFGFTEPLGVLLRKGKEISACKIELRGHSNSRVYPIKTDQRDTSGFCVQDPVCRTSAPCQ